MGNDNYVDEKVCQARMEKTDEKEETNTQRLNAHSVEIKQLTRIADQLTQLMNINTKQAEAFAQRLEEVEKRIPVETKKPWYESDTGKLLIRAGVVLIFLLLAAAIGRGFIEALQPVTTVIGKG